MALRRARPLLASLAALALVLPSAQAAEAAESSPGADREYSTCSGTSHPSGQDGTRLDVSEYRAGYGCVAADRWSFTITTYDSWTLDELGYAALSIDTDLDETTGCDGFDYILFAFVADEDDEVVGFLEEQHDCDSSGEGGGPVTITHPAPNKLVIMFDNASIGSPSRIRWVGGLVSFAESEEGFEEVFPPNGTQLEENYLDSCSPAASPNARRSWSALPNDPGVAGQWNLESVRAEQAWDITHGSSSVVVAVLDSGVDATHPQLAGKLVPGYDATTGAALAPGNTDEVGHGTMVAGLIGARTNDGVGLAGLGWDTRVMPVKIGGLNGATIADEAEGIRWAVDNGARIINLSLGSCLPNDVERAAVEYAESRNVLVVAASGNHGYADEPEYPAAYPTVIAVGASTSDDRLATYSSTGDYVDIAAPGGPGETTYDEYIDVLHAGGGQTQAGGTSIAAPHVSAAAALVYARLPAATPAQVRNLLTSTARDAGVPGPDRDFGAGILDVGRAVNAAAPVQPPTLRAPATATAGVLITVSGTAQPGTSVSLWGVTAPNGTITRVNTPSVTADASGSWTKTIRPLRNVTLQARVGTTSSPTRFIAVSTAVKQTASALTGCVVQVSGSVFEPKPGATVFIRARDSAGRTVSLGNGTVERDGRFLLRRGYGCGQQLDVYTVISGDNVNRPGSTGVQRVTTHR